VTVKTYRETRDWYGETLVELAKKDRNVIALDCDLGRSTRSHRITEVDESRFIEMGIAEQDMISTASGLASMGKIPFTNSFAIFITGRAFDQIRQQVALPNANVKICGSSAGLTVGPDGATHQSVLDISIMRTLPNMVVLSPADGPQTIWAVRTAYEYKGPVYIRLSRLKTDNVFADNTEFELGRGIEIEQGKEIVLISHGPVSANVVTATNLLKEKGINAGHVNFPTIKPLDAKLIEQLAEEYSYIVSVEENSIIGGLGTATAEVISEMDRNKAKARLIRLGIKDTFGESGAAEELLKKYGLDAESITDTVLTQCR
jgi:transketolase